MVWVEADLLGYSLIIRWPSISSIFFWTLNLFLKRSLSFTAIPQFNGIALNSYVIGVSIANAVMLVGFQNARNGDYFLGQKKIKQGMGIAMLAFIAAAGL